MTYSKKHIAVQDAPTGRGPYPQAVRCGPWVFVSGQGPLSTVTNAPIEGSFAEQVHLTLDNVAAILAGARLGLEHIAKVTVYLSDLAMVEEFNAIYVTRMPEPRPARTLVMAGLRGIDVELDVIALDPRGPAGAAT
jgi:2-iminobutanoate/2-iminopropanoate deaminase